MTLYELRLQIDRLIAADENNADLLVYHHAEGGWNPVDWVRLERAVFGEYVALDGVCG